VASDLFGDLGLGHRSGECFLYAAWVPVMAAYLERIRIQFVRAWIRSKSICGKGKLPGDLSSCARELRSESEREVDVSSAEFQVFSMKLFGIFDLRFEAGDQ
jgi:hypothetical protein